MDEYVGLLREHREPYRSFMHRRLFPHFNIAPVHVHILDGNASSLDTECAEYEAKIRSYGGVDLCLGGVGSVGHIAFNELGSSLASRTRVKALAFDTTIMDAREVIIIIATREGTAIAVQRAVEDTMSHMCTLSCLQMHSRRTIVVDDEEATLGLQFKTVKSSTSVERHALGIAAVDTELRGIRVGRRDRRWGVDPRQYDITGGLILGEVYWPPHWSES
ncbi:Uu.00g139500.m01.CDS01 [Anthostomella pinea]|uniref:Uu.00g139500.m01.CDS01 n=1 Tax=Anthostomella pinea TaxID=933095 RepID=A0AAI8VQP8_9PEZI|nr:Uu.00g139500.m01.CDS01 [Anthostomella pinea]